MGRNIAKQLGLEYSKKKNLRGCDLSTITKRTEYLEKVRKYFADFFLAIPITKFLLLFWSYPYGWNQPGREKAKKLGILPFTYWVLLTTYIFFALLEIVMCLKHIEASHIMAFNS